MSNMWVALLLAVTGGIGYQLSQKLLPTNINPFLIFAKEKLIKNGFVNLQLLLKL